MKLLLYCTKARPYIWDKRNDSFLNTLYFFSGLENKMNVLNGKIVGECDFEVEEIRLVEHTDWWDFETGTMYENELCRKSCLDHDELTDYLIAYGKTVKHYGYAIHIKNLKIFNEPKELSHYWSKHFNEIKRAPQNMMEVIEDAEGGFGNHYILISIHPEYLCKILNGEKTIEVRKKVLKEMIN